MSFSVLGIQWWPLSSEFTLSDRSVQVGLGPFRYFLLCQLVLRVGQSRALERHCMRKSVCSLVPACPQASSWGCKPPGSLAAPVQCTLASSPHSKKSQRHFLLTFSLGSRCSVTNCLKQDTTQHLRGQVSSKACQCGIRTPLPSTKPQPCPLQKGPSGIPRGTSSLGAQALPWTVAAFTYGTLTIFTVLFLLASSLLV